MTERGLSRASWGAFAALVGLLYLSVSCSDSSDGADEPREPAPSSSSAASTTDPDPSTTTATPTTDPDPAAFTPPTDNPDTLEPWNQLSVTGDQLVLNDGVTPYELNSPLFTDYAHKLRTVWMPADAGGAGYQPDSAFDFPVGTVVTKTFYYPEPEGAAPADGIVLRTDPPADVEFSLDLDEVRLMETRVLVHREDGWHALPYVWNEDETEATLERTGAIARLSIVDDSSEAPLTYVVPDVNQCAGCHATNHSTGAIQTIGLQARHLNRDVDLGDGTASQLDRWRDLGLLADAPPSSEIDTAAVWDDDSASLDDRARAYLDINCAHCHSPVGAADTSGLFLDHQTEIGYAFGICKPPIAAGSGTGGRTVDIWPGQPDESILVYRMETTEPDAMMPELGRTSTHDEGVDLIEEWIASLPGSCDTGS